MIVIITTCKYKVSYVWQRGINIYTIFWLGLLVVLSARWWLAAWMDWSCIDVIVLGFKSIEELYLL